MRKIVSRYGNLVGHRENAGVRQRTRRGAWLVNTLRTVGQLAGQRQPFGGRALTQPGLGQGAQPVGETVHSGQEGSHIIHSATLCAVHRLLPTPKRSGTVR